MSSTFRPQWSAASAIDGNLATICASLWQTNAWLSIETPSRTAVDYVAIYNRADMSEYAEWLNPYEVWVSDAAGDFESPAAIKCAGPLSSPVKIGVSVTAESAIVIGCPWGTLGSHVSVRQVGRPRYLTLLEVEIYRQHYVDHANMAAGLAASQPSDSIGQRREPKKDTAGSVAATESRANGPPQMLDALPAFDTVTPPVAGSSPYWLSADAHASEGGNGADHDVAGLTIVARCSQCRVATITLASMLGAVILALVCILIWACRLSRQLNGHGGRIRAKPARIMMDEEAGGRTLAALHRSSTRESDDTAAAEAEKKLQARLSLSRFESLGPYTSTATKARTTAGEGSVTERALTRMCSAKSFKLGSFKHSSFKTHGGSREDSERRPLARGSQLEDPDASPSGLLPAERPALKRWHSSGRRHQLKTGPQGELALNRSKSDPYNRCII